MTAVAVLAAARARGWRIATAESCTGGLVAAALTEVPGSSDVVDRGFVTYSNAAKREMLGVAAATRIVAALSPAWSLPLLHLAAGAWIIAFAGFAIVYGPLLARPRSP